ncbi:cobalt chelatase [Amycolatopsis antarctica]|uniref:Cobalt chelatase n=2 Tax=Amycolatopsis antarctica TaxID=1854586 RepID=A0A263CZW5_9PSEU|nr:cobalt chelatase [Amycolatopsis antarctica]
MRALSGERELCFRGHRPYRGRQPVPSCAPHLRLADDDGDLASLRGVADGVALRLLGSDAVLHRRLRPADPVERVIFELLEQFRVESLAPDSLPGVRANVRRRFEQWSTDFHRAGLTETEWGLLFYTVAQVCRSRLTRVPVLAETDDLLEVTRASLAPMIGHDLAGLRRHRHDQERFAVHALSIASAVGGLIRDGGGVSGAETADEDRDVARPTLLVDFDEEGAGDGEQAPRAGLGRSAVLAGSRAGYRAFTTAYDRQRAAVGLVRPALLRDYREQLDRRVAAQGVNAGRLARELTAVLAEPTPAGWDGGQEEGLVDARALAQLISSPTERRLFRTERIEPVADVLVTFLIDCSGSMKHHREAVAVLVDVFARAVEQAGGRCEILGFTTGAWNGGRARRDWSRAGRPRHPGRLNEQCHIVFKDAGTPWRRARSGIAGLLKADLFREGVDGEAVAWAAARARRRESDRSVLIVVSDGSPMDSATNLANDPRYLEHHLAEVVAGLERSGQEIHGIGVGLDLSEYFGSSRILDTSIGRGYAMFGEIVGLLARRSRR